jgi:hypothetical protein
MQVHARAPALGDTSCAVPDDPNLALERFKVLLVSRRQRHETVLLQKSQVMVDDVFLSGSNPSR